MIKIKIIDCHPGKYQDNMELILISVIDHKHRENFITGFRDSNSNDNRGMFNEKTEPIQVLKKDKEGNWLFTMSNISDITRDEIQKLLNDGYYHLTRKFEDGYVYFDLELNLLK